MSESKNFLIIGGSSGIGLALAKQLIAGGHRVTITSRTPTSLAGANAIVFDALKDELPISSLGDKLHGVAYCPGSINLKPFHRLTDQDFLEDFQLNVLGGIKAVRAALPLLKNSGDASIVFFSTVAVGQGMSFHASVAASKGAVEGLTRSLAAELAPKIRVNAIAPSLTNTPLASKLLASEDKLKASNERHPLKRVGESNDIASMARFLLTEEGSWISGQVIGVDGGLSALR